MLRLNMVTLNKIRNRVKSLFNYIMGSREERISYFWFLELLRAACLKKVRECLLTEMWGIENAIIITLKKWYDPSYGKKIK